jgi:uncharacterized protein YyaL (SSP411 family)
MPNPYITNVNPYFAQQDQQGLSPVFQNIANQQANQQAALAQQNQQVMQAGQTQQGGMNPMAMAQALRNKPTQDQMNAKDAQMGGLGTYNPISQYQVSNAYGTNPYSQQSRMLAAQEF